MHLFQMSYQFVRGISFVQVARSPDNLIGIQIGGHQFYSGTPRVLGVEFLSNLEGEGVYLYSYLVY